MAKERPILFNTYMVRAILGGRKTQTRRVIKPQGIKCYKGAYAKPCNGRYLLNTVANSLYCSECGNIIEYSLEGKDYCKTIDAPYRKGDTLWVRETWCIDDLTPDDIYYRANYSDREAKELFGDVGLHWRPSIHMPRKAARIFL